jgi:hypothetical protein
MEVDVTAMKKTLYFTTILLLIFGLAMTSSAALFSDNFNAENGGVGALNYYNFSNWTVTDAPVGAVDLIGNGSFDFLPGNGLYVDLDGSKSKAGIFTTKISFTFENGTNYQLSFDLAGSHRGSTETVNITLGSLVNDSKTLLAGDPFTNFTYLFTGDGSTAALSFLNLGGDQVGALLDNVNLDVVQGVPEPATLLLIGGGLITLVGFRRKFKK